MAGSCAAVRCFRLQFCTTWPMGWLQQLGGAASLAVSNDWDRLLLAARGSAVGSDLVGAKHPNTQSLCISHSRAYMGIWPAWRTYRSACSTLLCSALLCSVGSEPRLGGGAQRAAEVARPVARRGRGPSDRPRKAVARLPNHWTANGTEQHTPSDQTCSRIH